MIDTKNFQQLFEKEMTRKQFLHTVIALIVSVVGLTAFVRNFNSFTHDNSKTNSQAGYGSNPYGR